MNEPQQDSEFDPFAESRKAPASGKGLTWLALLLAAAAIALGGWQWWEGRSTEVDDTAGRLDEMSQRVAASDRRLGALDNRLQESERLGDTLAELQLDLARLHSRVDDLQRNVDAEGSEGAELQDELQSLSERVAGAEAGVAALAIRNESPTETIELAQVDFLLRTAHERLQLFHDRRTAVQALDLADGQLAALDDPLYLPVRRAIADARLAIADLPERDLIGLTARLDRLQARIAGLPFPGEAAPAIPLDDVEAGDDAEPGIWARFTAAMAGLVTVRRRVDDASLINLDDKDYIRQGLWLQIESARLALVRQDTAAWAASLARADATLEQYFDAGAAVSQRWRDELTALAAVDWDLPVPDISAPWARLNLLRTGTTSGAAPPDVNTNTNTDTGADTDPGTDSDTHTDPGAEPQAVDQAPPEAGEALIDEPPPVTESTEASEAMPEDATATVEGTAGEGEAISAEDDDE